MKLKYYFWILETLFYIPIVYLIWSSPHYYLILFLIFLFSILNWGEGYITNKK